MFNGSTKVLSIVLVAILLGPSFQGGIQNFLSKSSQNDVQKAFASSQPVDVTQIGNYALFGLHNVIIAENVTFNTGSVGAQNAQPNKALPANAEVIIKGNSNFADPTSVVAGDSVIINKGTTVQNVFYNELQNSGTIAGAKNTPLALPVVKQLPSFPRSTPGTASIDVPMDKSVTLQPGQYGTITVEQGGTVNFVGGIYNVTSITAKRGANLIFNSPSQVVVQDQIACDKDTFVGPSENSGIHSHDIIIYVEGKPTINQNATSADFGKDAIVDVNMYAPTGSIEMDEGTNATGAFIADMVTVQQDSVIKLDSAFGIQSLLDKYQGILSALGSISDVSNEAVVTDFLNQNLTSLIATTTNLVSDSQSRNTLVSILNSSLQSVNLASNNVLALDKTEADTNLNDARSSINNYITQVNSLSGTTIPTSTANILISEANQGLAGSLETGSNIAVILRNNQLTVTSQLINKAISDDTTLQQTVSSLISKGFSVTLDAQHHSPTVADILITNSLTQQSFDIVIPQSTLAMFATLGFYYQSVNDGTTLTTQQIAGLMNVAPSMENNIIISAASSSLVFVYYELCDSNFAVNDCKNGLQNPNATDSIFKVNASFVSLSLLSDVGDIFIQCVIEENCQAVMQELSYEYSAEQLTNWANQFEPSLFVVVNVSNTHGGTALPGDFTVSVTGNNPNPSVFRGENGVGTLVSLRSGQYLVTENPKTGYSESIPSGDGCDTDAETFNAYYCTITNSDIPPPIITSPANGAAVSSSTISGTSLPTATITIYEGTTQIGTTVADSNGIWSLTPSLPSGSNTVTATESINGGISQQSDPVTFTYTPVSPIVFSENFDEATPPTSNGWTISPSTSGLDFSSCLQFPSSCIQQYSTDLFGHHAPSTPYWGGVGSQIFYDPNCNSEYAIATKSFSVYQSGNYTVSASLSPPVSTIIPQLYVDSNLVFNEYDESNTHIRNDSKVISLSAGTHSVGIAMNSEFACNGLFVAYFDNILIKQTSDPDPSYRPGGPLFAIQLGQNSVNMTSGSSAVVPLDVTWSNGSSTESVSATFLGNTTSVIPAITSVSNTTSSEMFNVTLNVPSGTQSGGYDVGVKIIGPDGDYRIAGIFIKVQ